MHAAIPRAALLLASILALLLCPNIRASTWDPHVFPKAASDGPFFEGWYMRAVLPERNESVAVIVGAGLLAENTTDDAIAVYVAILHGDPQTGRTRVYERFSSNLKAVGVTHMGREVTEQPAWDTPPAFRWALHEESGEGKGEGEGREVVTFSTVDDVAFVRAEAGGAVVKMVAKVTPWSYDGPKKPHSWSDVIDRVPLHWYIHSLSSELLSLELQTPEAPLLSFPPTPLHWDLPPSSTSQADETATPPSEAKKQGGQRGLVHLEKNWGRAFPSAWVWVQGVVAFPPLNAHTGPLPPLDAHTGPQSLRGHSTSEGQGPIASPAQKGAWPQGEQGEASEILSPSQNGASPSEEGASPSQEGEALLAVTFSWGVAVGPVHAHLAYVRDTGLGLAWDMKPSNSHVTAHHVDACDNQVHFVAEDWGLGRSLELRVVQPADSAGPLMGPTRAGFQRLCAESFQASATVTLREKGQVLRANVTIPLVALEFGGDFLCRAGAAGEAAER